jgi:hypothetical protein
MAQAIGSLENLFHHRDTEDTELNRKDLSDLRASVVIFICMGRR